MFISLYLVTHNWPFQNYYKEKRKKKKKSKGDKNCDRRKVVVTIRVIQRVRILYKTPIVKCDTKVGPRWHVVKHPTHLGCATRGRMWTRRRQSIQSYALLITSPSLLSFSLWEFWSDSLSLSLKQESPHRPQLSSPFTNKSHKILFFFGYSLY